MRIGAEYVANGRTKFTVWAPLLKKVELKIVSPNEKLFPMEPDVRGYWHLTADGVLPGSRYLFMLEGERSRPDPASGSQPDGVHAPSMVVDHRAFSWEDDDWRGVPLADMIMYELHTGTFSAEGTFEAIIPILSELKDLGINAIEIMPVAQFPGERNWGYDGVYPFAVQTSYGGPEGLKRLVNQCHKNGISVILDVVYNHLGPEGNYLWDFAPYFTDRYKTPWGWAVNFDGPYSNEVRNYFIENALFWFREFHIDALRLDAVHGITDMSATPFLRELAERVDDFRVHDGRMRYLIAESDLNDSRIIRSRDLGGFGMDAQWCDDFHHSLRTLVTGQNDGYYVDFGKMEHLERSMRDGYVYSGQYSIYRKRNHGNTCKDQPADRFVVFSQNHDQVGNRMLGERLSTIVSFEALKVMAGAVILSPYIPMLFMGEEYAEEAPFLYFVSHSDPALIEAVRKGRKEEFRAFSWKGEPPDPQSVETFMSSKLQPEKINIGKHRIMIDFYRRLIKIRKEFPPLSSPDRERLELHSHEIDRILTVRRWTDDCQTLCIFNFDRESGRAVFPDGKWRKAIDSSDTAWGGSGTVLPEVGLTGMEISLAGETVAVYTLEGKG